MANFNAALLQQQSRLEALHTELVRLAAAAAAEAAAAAAATETTTTAAAAAVTETAAAIAAADLRVGVLHLRRRQ